MEIKSPNMDQFRLNVYSVMGVGCVGKSTYCNKMIDNLKVTSGNRPVLLQIGKILRGALGTEFFLRFNEPGSPVETDDWVKSLFTDAVMMAIKYKMHLVVDGFPRNERQLIWMLTSSKAQNYNAVFNFHFLHCEEDVLRERIEQRIQCHQNPAIERELIMRRNVYEVEQIVALQKEIEIAKTRFKADITCEHVEF